MAGLVRIGYYFGARAVKRQRPEQQIQGAVFEHLKARGAPGLFAWHPFSGGYRRPIEAAIYTRLGARPGLPDVMILHQGRLFCLELKADTGRLTDIQRNTIEAMQAAGATVAVCHASMRLCSFSKPTGWCLEGSPHELPPTKGNTDDDRQQTCLRTMRQHQPHRAIFAG
jgi:hypothetical protein